MKQSPVIFSVAKQRSTLRVLRGVHETSSDFLSFFPSLESEEHRNSSMFSSEQLELKDSWCWIRPVSLDRNAMRELSTMNPICWPPGTKICRVYWAQGSELWAFPGFLPWSPGALEPYNSLKRCALTVNRFPDLVLVILTALTLLSSKFLFWITHFYMFL